MIPTRQANAYGGFAVSSSSWISRFFCQPTWGLWIFCHCRLWMEEACLPVCRSRAPQTYSSGEGRICASGRDRPPDGADGVCHVQWYQKSLLLMKSIRSRMPKRQKVLPHCLFRHPASFIWLTVVRQCGIRLHRPRIFCTRSCNPRFRSGAGQI